MTDYITFNGVKSTDYHLAIATEMQQSTAVNDVEVVEVMGRDGAVIISNHRLKPVKQTIPFLIRIPYLQRKKVYEIAQDISNWLAPTSWCDFSKSWEPQYLYKAIVVDDFSVEETLEKTGKVAVTFMLHPVKYLIEGQKMVPLVNHQSLQNPTNRPSKPYFELRGSGNCTVNFGNEQMKFQNVSGGVNVDCEKSAVWYGNTSAYDTVASENFITLPTGNFTVSWDNPSFSLTLKPNWGVKV